MKTEKFKNGNFLISLSLNTVSPCKNEQKIWMIVSLYYNDQKLRFNSLKKISSTTKLRWSKNEIQWIKKINTNNCNWIMEPACENKMDLN